MVYFKSEHCVTEGSVVGAAEESAADCVAIAATMYETLSDMDADAAQMYIDLIGELASDPDGFLAKYAGELEENT